jgi:hypothetical protein
VKTKQSSKRIQALSQCSGYTMGWSVFLNRRAAARLDTNPYWLTPSVVMWLSLWEAVLHGRLWSQELSAWSWRISAVKSRCQITTGEETARWKRLSGCCGYLWIVEINGGAVTACNSEWSINPFIHRNPVYSHTYLVIIIIIIIIILIITEVTI